MLLVALAIKLTSRGPVFFRQRRYGLDGREILVWKFRTMTVCEDGHSVAQATKSDSRVTPLGAVLRRTSIDELPQLFNVLDGSMSLVGPRPHAAAHNEQYRKMIEGYMLRHKVKPGITGLAQVRGWRGETDTLEKMQRRVECDHEYIREWSLWLDVKILFRTVFVVLSSRQRPLARCKLPRLTCLLCLCISHVWPAHFPMKWVHTAGGTRMPGSELGELHDEPGTS